jgi:hypothetical protein
VKQQLDWRRAKVLELSSKGYSEREVGEILKVSVSAVHRDLVFIRRQAKENLQKHIDERIPEEYEKCIAGTNTVLKITSYIANTVEDPRIKIQALSLMNEVYKVRMELATNSGIIRDALDYVNGKAEKLAATNGNALKFKSVAYEHEESSANALLYSESESVSQEDKTFNDVF